MADSLTAALGRAPLPAPPNLCLGARPTRDILKDFHSFQQVSSFAGLFQNEQSPPAVALAWSTCGVPSAGQQPPDPLSPHPALPAQLCTTLRLEGFVPALTDVQLGRNASRIACCLWDLADKANAMGCQVRGQAAGMPNPGMPNLASGRGGKPLVANVPDTGSWPACEGGKPM